MTRTGEDRHGEFPEVPYALWRSKVEADLRGASFETRLVTATREGLAVEPLYCPKPRSTPMPHVIRGTREPWAVWQDVRDPHPDAAARTMRDALSRGVEGFWLSFDGATMRALDRDAPGAARHTGAFGISVSCYADLEAVLAPIDLDRHAIALKGGAGAYALSEFLWGILDARGHGTVKLRGCAGLDPIGTLLRTGTLPGSIEAAFDALTRTAKRWIERAPSFRTALVSTLPPHEAGASSVDEVAFALASGLTTLRRLVAAGLDVPRAAGQILFAFAVGRDLFMEIAKLRAFRRLWSGMLAASGAPEAAGATWIHTTSSSRDLTRWDAWTNLLRTTTQTFSAAVGGADSTSITPFDALRGSSDARAHRLATNVHALLVHESHLDATQDPAAGSYYVESLTGEIARAAWSRFQSIESRGGLENEITSGRLAAELAAALARRMDDVARARVPIVGVSQFPNLDEAPPAHEFSTRELAARPIHGARLSARSEWQLGPTQPARATLLPARREADLFERLRDASTAHRTKGGRAPAAGLIRLGAPSDGRAEASFAKAALATAGIRCVDVVSPEGAARAFDPSQLDIAVICGSEAQIGAELTPLAATLEGRGARVVLVACRPGPFETAWRRAGMDHALYEGCDVVVTLGAVLSQLGIALPHGALTESLS